MPARILIAEDDQRVQEFLKGALLQSGMNVQVVSAIPELSVALEDDVYDILLLDRVMKGSDTLKQIPILRSKSPEMKILILSAYAQVEQRVQGLQAGADDYLAKPYHLDELMARIQALLRRGGSLGVSPGERSLERGDLHIDLDTQRATRGGAALQLTFKEFKLLVILATDPHRLFTRANLLHRVWDMHFDPDSNVVDVTLGRLRRKLNLDGLPPLIHPKRGVGYSLWTSH